MPTTPQDEEDQGNLSSSSSSISSGGFDQNSGGRRSRHSSNASSSSERNRVQDLIDSLERSSSTRSGMEEGTMSESQSGRRSLSPTKLSGNRFSSNQHHHSNFISAPPPKPPGGRPLPTRAAVNNLFSPTAVEAHVAVEEKEHHPTIKQVAKKNVHGREPRMLPFPPTQSAMLPMSPPQNVYPYPPTLTPDYSGNGSFTMSSTGYASPPAYTGDFELGFRPHVYSPHSQAYMVQHNPASPSNSGSSGKRLLPYPPVMGEAQLHHPKPRRLVGTTTGADEDGLEELVEGNSGAGGGYESESESRLGTLKGSSVPIFSSGTSADADDTTEGYVTAFDDQSQSGTSVYEPAEDELSIEDLLASEEQDSSFKPLSNSISGVEAWEMDLGDTIKRIREETGGINSSVNAKRGSSGSVAEIGRKAGRGMNGSMGSRRAGVDGIKRRGIMGLFEFPGEIPVPEEDSSPAAPVALVENHSAEDALAERERLVAARETAVLLREEAVTEGEQSAALEWSTWRERQASEEERLEIRLKEISGQSDELEQREKVLNSREEELQKKDQELKDREDEVKIAESNIPSTPFDLLKRCWRMFLQPGSRTEAGPSSDKTTIRPSSPYRTHVSSIRRDFFLGRLPGGYFVLMGIGFCVVALKVLKRTGFMKAQR